MSGARSPAVPRDEDDGLKPMTGDTGSIIVGLGLAVVLAFANVCPLPLSLSIKISVRFRPIWGLQARYFRSLTVIIVLEPEQ